MKIILMEKREGENISHNIVVNHLPEKKITFMALVWVFFTKYVYINTPMCGFSSDHIIYFSFPLVLLCMIEDGDI